MFDEYNTDVPVEACYDPRNWTRDITYFYEVAHLCNNYVYLCEEGEEEFFDCIDYFRDTAVYFILEFEKILVD